jgi:hypothetical protein
MKQFIIDGVPDHHKSLCQRGISEGLTPLDAAPAFLPLHFVAAAAGGRVFSS